ncbi:DNA-3-methyladenine glycosylase [Neobacillus cucumis]|uniref:DNA-3-methyladenine glycosylase family protein n=1 Tax=Neobacillus cucumis TaxID=1740721 RepID=UPI00256FD8B0|nr:DNA-3-methyladenine glycosylase [Neobacillus cucumis]
MINWKDHEHELTLFTPKEFNFKENLNYLTRSSIECMYVIKDERIYKAVSVGQEIPIIEIHADAEDNLVIRFLGNSAPPSKLTRTAVAHYVWEWFDLERDLVPFYKMAKKDSLLKETADSFYGLRIMGIPDLFEALCWGILGQQINLTFAYTLKRRLVEKFGRCVKFEGESYWLFPTPSVIAHLSVEELLELRMTVKKCEYLIDVANLMVEGKLTKEILLDTGNLKGAEKMLVSIRGIGPWTANYVLMRCLRFPEAFPIDDVGLHNAIKHLLCTDKKPTKNEISHLAANWTGWEAYATFYLWRILY